MMRRQRDLCKSYSSYSSYSEESSEYSSSEDSVSGVPVTASPVVDAAAPSLKDSALVSAESSKGFPVYVNGVCPVSLSPESSSDGDPGSSVAAIPESETDGVGSIGESTSAPVQGYPDSSVAVSSDPETAGVGDGGPTSAPVQEVWPKRRVFAGSLSVVPRRRPLPPSPPPVPESRVEERRKEKRREEERSRDTWIQSVGVFDFFCVIADVSSWFGFFLW